METLLNITMLSILEPKEKFYVLRNGNCFSYIFCCVSPLDKRIVIATDGGNYLKATCFNDGIFTSKNVVLRGTYSSKEVGLLLKRQLNEEIESIEKIYLS